METMTDAILIEQAQKLFKGFAVTVGENPDVTAAAQYDKSMGELIRRGYSPVITIQFVK